MRPPPRRDERNGKVKSRHWDELKTTYEVVDKLTELSSRGVEDHPEEDPYHSIFNKIYEPDQKIVLKGTMDRTIGEKFEVILHHMCKYELVVDSDNVLGGFSDILAIPFDLTNLNFINMDISYHNPSDFKFKLYQVNGMRFAVTPFNENIRQIIYKLNDEITFAFTQVTEYKWSVIISFKNNYIKERIDCVKKLFPQIKFTVVIDEKQKI